MYGVNGRAWSGREEQPERAEIRPLLPGGRERYRRGTFGLSRNPRHPIRMMTSILCGARLRTATLTARLSTARRRGAPAGAVLKVQLCVHQCLQLFKLLTSPPAPPAARLPAATCRLQRLVGATRRAGAACVPPRPRSASACYPLSRTTSEVSRSAVASSPPAFHRRGHSRYVASLCALQLCVTPV